MSQMSDLKMDLNRQLNEAQHKYTYFLLAVAASAIALVVQRTTDRSLDGSLILLGFAVLSWAASFGAGCRNRAFFMSTLYANVSLLQLQDGSHPNRLSHPEMVNAACDGVRSAARANSASGNFWGKSRVGETACGARTPRSLAWSDESSFRLCKQVRWEQRYRGGWGGLGGWFWMGWGIVRWRGARSWGGAGRRRRPGAFWGRFWEGGRRRGLLSRRRTAGLRERWFRTRRASLRSRSCRSGLMWFRRRRLHRLPGRKASGRHPRPRACNATGPFGWSFMKHSLRCRVESRIRGVGPSPAPARG